MNENLSLNVSIFVLISWIGRRRLHALGRVRIAVRHLKEALLVRRQVSS